MNREIDATSPQVVAAITDLQNLIKGRYPDATFAVYEGDDPDGIYLDAVVDVENATDVLDLIVEKLAAIQIDRELPVYVVVGLPEHRLKEQLRARTSMSAGSR